MNHVPPEVLGWLEQALLYLALFTSVLAAVLGVWLLLHPPSLLRFHTAASRWIATGPYMEKLETPRRFDSFFYRNHRLFGILIIFGALYGLVGWLNIHQHQGLAKLIGPALSAQNLDWIATGLEVCFIALNLAFLPLGLAILLRPSLLKGFERWADRWVKMSEAARFWDGEHYPLDLALTRHPRVTGVAILLASTYIISSLSGLALL